MTENDIFTVNLDRPRRLRMTIDSAALAEEELGDLLEFMKQQRSDDDYAGDVLWAMSLADDPEITRLEAKKIIQMTIWRAPKFIAMKRARAFRAATIEALKAFYTEVFEDPSAEKEK